jgi:predicted metal-binding membrane protein
MDRQPQALISATAPRAGRWRPFGLVGGQAALAGALLTLAGVAWAATDIRMAGMDAGPGTNPGALGFYLGTWVLMMGAMMLPSITPMVLAYRELGRQRRGRRDAAGARDTGLFVAAYLLVWATAGLLAYALLQAGRTLDGGFFAWDRAGRWAAAGVLAAAALYQLTPLKKACLSRCRSRRALLSTGGREGRAGAVRAGVAHGTWCVGCCWALMAALFALGAMSVGWMVLIAALIAAERLMPWRVLATAGVAMLLAVVAIGVAVAPARVPMLTIPGSPPAMRATGMSPAGKTGISPAHMQMPAPVRMAPLTGPTAR